MLLVVRGHVFRHALFLSCATGFWGNPYLSYHIHIYQLEYILMHMVVYIFIYIKCLESIQAVVER